VEKGQRILQLSNPDLQLNYINQEANIVSQINQIRTLSIQMEQQSLNLREQSLDVEFNLDLFSKRTKRNATLFDDNVIAKVDFEETQDQYEHLLRRKKMLDLTISKDSLFQDLQQQQMSTSLDLMKKNLDFSQKNLDNLTIRAPIGGQLSGLNKELGELISEGENIAQMDDLTNFKIRARIDEFYISRIFMNQEGSFQFANKSYNLRIKKIYPQVTNGSFQVDMIFTDKFPEGIKRGQTVSIKLQLSAEQQALLLARGSFYQTTGGNWVYVIDTATGNAQKRNIKVGKQNPNYYEVLEGLVPGDVVITSSYENFGDKDELVLK
jgi:HlyD family secretion protein